MSNIIREYKEVEGQTMEIKLYYDLGGMNYFTGSVESRGYYLSVSPVEISHRPGGLRSVKYVAFSGVKKLLLEVKRKSKRSEGIAVDMMEDNLSELIDAVIKKASA